MDMSPISWKSKKQNNVEGAIFGSEFIAMKLGMEDSRALRYNLRMMGVPIDGPTFVYGDILSIMSTLKKKLSSVAYHVCRESVAMGENLTSHIRSQLNPADLCTKVIPCGNKRDSVIDLILHDLGDNNE